MLRTTSHKHFWYIERRSSLGRLSAFSLILWALITVGCHQENVSLGDKISDGFDIERPSAKACRALSDDSLACIVKTQEHWLNKSIAKFNKQFEQGAFSSHHRINLIDLSEVTEIKAYALLMTEGFELNPYLNLEIWTCKDADGCNKTLQELKALNDEDWYYLHNSPKLFWTSGNSLYLATSRGNAERMKTLLQLQALLKG